MIDLHDLKLLAFPALHLLLAALIGAAIGWQRQMHGSPAGLRTHILVCTGSALLTTVDMTHAPFQGKIAAAVVSGIGFLGAGTIIHSDKGDSVRGLTTAASVWVTAGIGIAIGTGDIYSWLGVIVAVLVLTTLSVVYRLENFALRHVRTRRLTVIVTRPEGANADDIINRVVKRLTDDGAAVEGITKDKKTEHAGETVIHCVLRLPDGFQPDNILQTCTSDSDVIQAAWDV